MSYTIYKASGTGITVPDSMIDASYYNPTGGDASQGLGVRLVGRNTPDYGTAIAQNFLQLTENFASNAVPLDSTSLQGQLWYNKASGVSGDLYVKSNNAVSGGIANWAKVLTVNAAGNLSIAGSMAATSFIGNLIGNASTVTTNANLTGDVTSIGNVTTLSLSGAIAGTYGSATQVPVITVNSKGRVTSVSNISISGGGAGTLQTVTDAGATTNHAIAFTQGGGLATISAVPSQTYLDLNGVCWAVDGPLPGIVPPTSGTHFCGGTTNRWISTITTNIDMSGSLSWDSLAYPVPPNTGTKFLCDNGTWATPAGGGGAVGSLQTVTDNGSTTNHAITLSGTGAGTAYINKVASQSYLDLNGVCWAVTGATPGIAPPTTGTHFCGGTANRWLSTITTNIDMTGGLSWNSLAYPVPPNTGTKYLCDNGTWATPAGGGGGSVGTLQQVTDLGSTTNHAITLSGTGAGSAYINKVSGNSYLDLNGVCWAVAGGLSGIVPPSDGTHFCGGSGQGWSIVYTYNTLSPSDSRQKEFIQDSTLGLNFINQLRPVSYKWKNANIGTSTHYGLIAQEVEALVSVDEFAGLSYDALTDRYSLGYTQFIAPMIKSIQELSAKNTLLESSLAVLEARLAALEAQ